MSRSIYARLAYKHGTRKCLASRREVLKAALAASAGVVLASCQGANPFERSGTGKRSVVVIGAGLAGLACAYELCSAGFEVLVFEARARIGGRVLTFSDMAGGKLVEAGGEFIGSNHPTWLAYAKRFQLPLKEVDEAKEAASPIVLGGKKLSKEDERRVYEEIAQAHAPLNEVARDVDALRPWLTPGAEALDSRSMGDWLRSVNVSDLAKRAIRADYEGEVGVAMERMSYLAFLAMVKGGGLERFWTESKRLRCASGNQALAAKFAAALGNRLRLGEAVTSLVVGNQRVMIGTAKATLSADDVVLAVPPSVWGKIRFTPELPATPKPQAASAVKFLAETKTRFWKAAGISGKLLTDGDISRTWEATAGQGNGAAVMTCYSGGPAAEHVRSREPVDRAAFYRRELDNVFEGFKEQVTASRFVDWPSDAWALGAGAFSAPGKMKAIGPTLAAGIDCLHFAGDYASFAFPGMMEGALSSGMQVARALAAKRV